MARKNADFPPLEEKHETKSEGNVEDQHLSLLRSHAGTGISQELQDAVKQRALPNLNWKVIWQLVQQYGPSVISILEKLLQNGNPAPVPNPPPVPITTPSE